MRNLIKQLLKPLAWWLYVLTHSQVRNLYFIVPAGGITHRSNSMSTTLNEAQKVRLDLGLSSAHGNPTQPLSVPVWDTSNAAIATVTPSADGLSAEVTTAGALGTAVITVTVDGLTATDSIEVVAGPAVAAALVASEPVAA